MFIEIAEAMGLEFRETDSEGNYWFEFNGGNEMYYGPYYGAIWNRMNLVIKNNQLVVVVGPCFI